MSALDILRQISLVLGLVVGVCYAYQIVYLFLPFLKRAPKLTAEKPTRYAILIAARNEEAVLPHLLQSIRMQDYPANLINTFVVADNCTDRTAQVAREHGAAVFSRFNTSRVGKGYALNFLLNQIAYTDGLENYDAFLVFDADNLLCPDYIRQINRVVSAGYDAFCGYRNSKNFGASWVAAGHAVWYLHDSIHLNASRMLLGISCAVTGTGFGFTRKLWEQIGGWKFFTLTEDVEFNTFCATRGVQIGYCPEAVLYDEQPQTFRQSWRQRTRWVQGGVQVSVRYWQDLLHGMARGGRIGYASLETATLSLWGYGTGALCGFLSLLTVLLVSGWMGVGKALLVALVTTWTTSLLVGALTVLTQWHRIRATLPQKLLAILVFPLHMLSYIPIAVSALFRKYQWPPIEHTAAVSLREISGK